MSKISSFHWATLVEHPLVTDTDRQTQDHSIYRASIASRGKNESHTIPAICVFVCSSLFGGCRPTKCRDFLLRTAFTHCSICLQLSVMMKLFQPRLHHLRVQRVCLHTQKPQRPTPELRLSWVSIGLFSLNYQLPAAKAIAAYVLPSTFFIFLLAARQRR